MHVVLIFILGPYIIIKGVFFSSNYQTYFVLWPGTGPIRGSAVSVSIDYREHQGSYRAKVSPGSQNKAVQSRGIMSSSAQATHQSIPSIGKYVLVVFIYNLNCTYLAVIFPRKGNMGNWKGWIVYVKNNFYLLIYFFLWGFLEGGGFWILSS